jgi:hypothetical protein
MQASDKNGVRENLSLQMGCSEARSAQTASSERRFAAAKPDFESFSFFED